MSRLSPGVPPVDRAAKWVPGRNVNQSIWHVAGDLAFSLSAGLSDRWLCLREARLISTVSKLLVEPLGQCWLLSVFMCHMGKVDALPDGNLLFKKRTQHNECGSNIYICQLPAPLKYLATWPPCPVTSGGVPDPWIRNHCPQITHGIIFRSDISICRPPNQLLTTVSDNCVL